MYVCYVCALGRHGDGVVRLRRRPHVEALRRRVREITGAAAVGVCGCGVGSGVGGGEVADGQLVGGGVTSKRNVGTFRK